MRVSTVEQRGAVPFPAYAGERVYMHEFTRAAGLPPDLRRWQDTVDAMLEGVKASGPIFLMVDQAPVKASATHRRPGLHVDGCWNPAIYMHGHGGEDDYERQRIDDQPREALILASDVLGCAAYVGAFEGKPGSGGDCCHIDTTGMLKVDLEPGRAWAGPTLTMLHEALPLRNDCLRTLVRLNVRGWRRA